MDFSNLKLLQALSGINPTQNQQVGFDFPSQGGITGNMQMPPMQKSGMFDNLFQPSQMGQSPIASPEFSQSLQGDDSARQQLISLLNSQPSRENYKPGFWTKLNAGLMSINNPGAGQEYLNRPYNQAMESWSAKLRPLGELANIDAREATNNRMIERNAQLVEKSEKDRASREQIASDKLSHEKDVLAERREYMEFQRFKFEHPNAVYKSDDKGFVYAINPQTNETQYLSTPEGDPIRSDKLPDMDRLQIQQNNRMIQIGQQHQNRLGEIAAGGEKEINVSEKTLPNKIELKKTIPGKNTAPTESSASTGKFKKGDVKIATDGKVLVYDGVGWTWDGKTMKAK